MKLTIAIPTYNRPDTVLDTILKLLSFPNSNQVKFLIIDNGSDVNIPKFFYNKLPNHLNINIKRFDTNDGFCESFYRLFDECDTEYLMSLSDEDYFELTYLNEVLEILNSESPNLLILSAKSNTRKLIKSNKTRIPLYKVKDETSYISGLIYKTKPVIENINFFRKLSNTEEFAFLYPAVLVAFLLALEGKCLRFKKSVIRIGVSIPSTILSRQGSAFYLPTERVHQYLSLISCLRHLELYLPKYKRKIKMFEIAAKLNFFGSILDAVGVISSQAQKTLLISAVKTVFFSYIRKLLTLLRII